MDETYGKGTNGNARNYFVKSEYYNTYGDGQQYEATGNEDASTKVSTSECGDKAFKYNNAADLDASGTTKDATTLEEYPYSEASYKTQGGTFTSDIVLAVNNSMDCYLFTGDETRYNIAPTTAMEHRAYAFYLMQIDLQVKDYNAKCKLTKVYDHTFYGSGTDKPMYGGVIKAYDNDDKEVPVEQAYVTVEMMKKALEEAEANEKITSDQILYLDFTNLYSVVVEDQKKLDELKEGLNPNCLIFFPVNTIYAKDNYVSKTKSGGFRACKNIVITDKQPFYSPYKITVPAENYATYTRYMTNPMNGKDPYATIVLPFSIELNNGIHTDEDSEFELRQMTANGCLSNDTETGSEGKDFWGKASFVVVSEPRTTPNKPYMVVMKQFSEGDTINFKISQKGSDISATTDRMNEDYTFTGEQATGQLNDANYTFTNYGSYCGKKLPKGDGWFYFAKGKFYNSKNLSEKYDYVYVLPYRAYYAYKSNNQAKDMAGFEVSFDEPTSIEMLPVAINNGLNIETSKGSLTLTALRTMPVSIVAASGVLVWKAKVESGQQETVALPSGLYIVNGKKVIIR